MRLDKKFEQTILDCALVNVVPTEYIYEDRYSEQIIKWLANSHIVKPEEEKINNNNIVDYLRYLDAKLSAVRKTFTFWDAYNIRESASSQSEFIQKYASLPNNSSLIINTPGEFTLNDKTYERGDIIVKDNYSNELLVKSQQSGVYIPTTVSADNNNSTLTLSFAYKQSGERIVNVSMPNTAPKDGTIYSAIFTQKDIVSGTNYIKLEKKFADNNGEPIYPFVECRSYETTGIGDRLLGFHKVIQGDNNNWYIEVENINFPFILIVK